jgi:hypothetical protein
VAPNLKAPLQRLDMVFRLREVEVGISTEIVVSRSFVQR